MRSILIVIILLQVHTILATILLCGVFMILCRSLRLHVKQWLSQSTLIKIAAILLLMEGLPLPISIWLLQTLIPDGMKGMQVLFYLLIFVPCLLKFTVIKKELPRWYRDDSNRKIEQGHIYEDIEQSVDEYTE